MVTIFKPLILIEYEKKPKTLEIIVITFETFTEAIFLQQKKVIKGPQPPPFVWTWLKNPTLFRFNET